MLLILILTICSFTDMSVRRIPNAVLLPALMTALFLNSVAGGVGGLLDSLAGLAVGLLMLMPLHILGRMGAGDIKLLGVVGSVLGGWGAVVAGLATMMAGGILAVTYVLWLLFKPEVASSSLPKFITGKTAAPDEEISLNAARAAEIPYAVAIAVGTGATLIYLDLLPGVIIT